jgi:DNA primase
VTVSGTALTEEQMRLVGRQGKKIKLFFDMDGAGKNAARKSAELALSNEMAVSIVAISSGKDAADMGKESPEKLSEAIKNPVLAPKYFLDNTLAKYDRTTPDGKTNIINEYAEFLIIMKNPIERAHWVKILAGEVDTSEHVVASVVNNIFHSKKQREYPSIKSEVLSQQAHIFGKRSELLREELIGLCLAEPAVRTILDESSVDAETKAWIGQHPLHFFVLQAGQGDPLSLIENQTQKSEATRLSFRALETPEVVNAVPEERAGVMADMARRYLEDLTREVTRREKLIALEHAIASAREKGDRDTEKSLLAEFVKVSAEK